jgi:hypothetical protein
LAKAKVLDAKTLASSIALSNGDGTFALRPLPAEAQFAPVNAVLSGDFDGDGRTDLLLAGNFHGVTPVEGQYDASLGVLLAATIPARSRLSGAMRAICSSKGKCDT